MPVRSLSVRRFFIYFIIVLFFLTVIYIYLNYLKNDYEDDLWENDRCISDLNALKYQLDVVTEYKDRLDKLLTDTQKKCDYEKERFKEIMDSCLAMKQQTSICQSQFEDLQIECKKAKEQADKCKKEMEKLMPAR
ncbi:unnamed protein product [Colias eurytheme]|nr:unnamed protein product [Colias eurytheme]